MKPDVADVLTWIREEADVDVRNGLSRYGIPNDRAFGIPMGHMKRFAKRVGRSHELAQELWETGWYEARTLAAFIDDPAEVTPGQMDVWAEDFDSWAICDTTCFHLFDRTRFAWGKAEEWAPREEEFVRRAAYAVIWGLSVHDKSSADSHFVRALALIEGAPRDQRPLVKKAMNMALRAVGKRNATLNARAIEVAERMAGANAKDRAWIGRHALKELTSERVQTRLKG